MTWYHNNSTPSTSSQEPGAAFSLTSYLATIQLELAKSRNTQETSCLQGNETESSHPSQSGEIYAVSTEHRGEDQLTFFAEGFLVKTSHQQGRELESAGSVRDYGRNMRESLERCGLKLSLPKILRFYAVGDLHWSSVILPKWGMMQDGVYWELGTLKHRTKESGCGLWLPTPTCHNAKEGAYPAEGTRNTKSLAWELGGKINPQFTEWMMGWPIDWTDLKPLGTAKFLKWQQQHSQFSQRD